MTAAYEGSRPAHGPGALPGLRVVDSSGVLGAYCSKLLADLGADVVKVEPPQGDHLRAVPPFAGDEPHPERSLVFGYYHANKRGVTLDRTRPGGDAVWARLVARADVVLHDSTAVEAQALAHPQQIVCSVTPYGTTGPYRNLQATHLTSSAMGGAFVVRSRGSVPVPVPVHQMYDGVGAHAALAILVALRNRPVIGGQAIEVSAHEVLAAKNFAIQRFAQSGYDEFQAPGDVAPPAGRWDCADGQVELLVYHAGQWASFVRMLGEPPELSDPELADSHARRRQETVIRSVVGPRLAAMTKVEVFEQAQRARIPCAPINTPAEFAVDPQTVGRGTFAEQVDHPHIGSHPLQRGFVASVPLTVARCAAPLLGQHNTEVYVGELRVTTAQLDSWKGEGLV
jgi:crotonobetainyl-CoA:carnitine CoA-transferase CaiB-like acyl-CoA transferase